MRKIETSVVYASQRQLSVVIGAPDFCFNRSTEQIQPTSQCCLIYGCKISKVFTLQTIPVCEADEFTDTTGKVSGFSLHTGVAAKADKRKKLERLCRYISRPAVSEKRLGDRRLARRSDTA